MTLLKKTIVFQVQMPLFFLLSGFCLTISYGKKTSTKEEKDENVIKENCIDYSDFIFGRASRILPIYYFCFFFALPLIPLGHGFFSSTDLTLSIGGSLASLFLVQTWILIFSFGPNGPSWTVSTMFFFYIFFPK